MVFSISAVQEKLAQTRACIVSNIEKTERLLKDTIELSDAVAELHIATDLRQVFD